MKQCTMISTIVMFVAATAFGQHAGGEGELWNILTYTDAYVEASSEVDDQLEKIDELRASLQTAKIRRDSQLSIEEIELNLQVAELAVREMENSVATNAVNLYIAYVSATREYQSSSEALKTSEESFVITSNRYEAEEESERTLLNARISLLQSQKSFASAEQKLRQAKNALVRALSLSETDTFVADELPMLDIADYDLGLDVDEIKAASSSYYNAYRTALLKEKELKAKAGSRVFTESEIKALEDELDAANDNLKTATWNLEDEIAGLEYDYAALKADIEIAELNLQVDATDLDSTELQFEYGEVLRTDRDSARQKVFGSRSSLKSLNENLFKTILEVVDLSGGSVRNELARLMAE